MYNPSFNLALFAPMSRTLFILFILIASIGVSQSDSIFHVIDIRVEGNQRTHEDAVIIHSRLKIDSWISIPGTQTIHAMKALWQTGNYKSVEIVRVNVKKGIELIIKVEEYFKLGSICYAGLTKSEQRRMVENLSIKKRVVYSPQSLKVIESQLNNYLNSKGYIENKFSLDSVVTNNGSVSLVYKVIKGQRFRVDNVEYLNTEYISKRQFNKSLNKIRPSIFLWPGSLYEDNGDNEIENIENIAKTNGYPYAEIDSLKLEFDKRKVNLAYSFNESTSYKFGEFNWKGNASIHDTVLNKLVEKFKGSIYSIDLINELLYFSNSYNDVSSLYYEQGYASMRLYHQLVPNEETGIIDIDIYIEEGNIMRFGNISFSGNIRTKEFVLLREVLTIPGERFTRSQIILSQQKLSQLDYFINAEMDVKMNTDTATKTVGIEYVVKEKISDKLYISGGYGTRLVGTVGFDFKNFSGTDLFKKGTRWNPLPAGGGQHLSLKGQTDGIGYYGGSFNIYEPWLRGKPIGLAFNASFASINDSLGNLGIFNIQSTLSHKPFKNDLFTYFNYSLGYRTYNANNFDVFGETLGKFNAVTLQAGMLKNTTSGGVFPTSGNRIETSIISSLPPSSRYTETEALSLSTEEKFKWFEYYKFKFSLKHYQSLRPDKNIVLTSKFGIGYLGYFNKEVGTVPFGRYFMGGTGITNFDVSANEYIGLRGYESEDISTAIGDPLAIKLSFELQKKVVETDQFMLSTHLFGEFGNTYQSLVDLDPYNLKSSIGFGGKVYAPIIGVIGIDVGWGLNKTDFNWKTPAVQFTIGMDIGDF